MVLQVWAAIEQFIEQSIERSIVLISPFSIAKSLTWEL